MKTSFGAIAFGIWISVSAFAQAPQLNELGYQELELVAGRIRQLCSPPNCIPVFIGRSNSLIEALFDAQHWGPYLELPASGLSELADQSNWYQNWAEHVLSPAWNQGHFKNINQVIAVDFVSSGRSLSLASQWLERFFDAQKAPIQVVMGGYGQEFNPPEGTFVDLGRGLDRSFRKGTLFYELNFSGPESLSRSPEWNPSLAKAMPVFHQNPEYDRWVNKLRARAQKTSGVCNWIFGRIFKKKAPVSLDGGAHKLREQSLRTLAFTLEPQFK